MLKALAHALHGGLDAQLPALMADLRRCLQDKSQVGGGEREKEMHIFVCLLYYLFVVMDARLPVPKTKPNHNTNTTGVEAGRAGAAAHPHGDALPGSYMFLVFGAKGHDFNV